MKTRCFRGKPEVSISACLAIVDQIAQLFDLHPLDPSDCHH